MLDAPIAVRYDSFSQVYDPFSQVAKQNPINARDNRRQLVEQVASSHCLSKSARLREMFAYVCQRVLDHDADEIHEQEVGRQVFGRPADYDTSADNIVRVHASMLRKRMDQYFSTEGSNEPLIIEIPRGNYAPVFRERVIKPVLPESQASIQKVALPAPAVLVEHSPDWRMWLAVALAVVFAGLSLFFFLRTPNPQALQTLLKKQPTVAKFWSHVFLQNKQTDVVLGDASLAIFEERTGHQVTLSEYFDRSYLKKIGDRAAAAKLDPALAESLLLKRQSSYGDVALLSKIADMAHLLQSDTKIRFARDYSFREVKADNVILLGNTGSNPWIEPFQDHLSLRWKFDESIGTYYPVDTAAAPGDQDKFRVIKTPDKPPGYATISFLPNLSGVGTVLIISGTGGSAMGAALDFLSDERSLTQLHSQLAQDKATSFPYFEALLKVGSRNTLPRDVTIVICRHLKQ